MTCIAHRKIYRATWPKRGDGFAAIFPREWWASDQKQDAKLVGGTATHAPQERLHGPITFNHST
jgi:hypothetical protein